MKAFHHLLCILVVLVLSIHATNAAAGEGKGRGDGGLRREDTTTAANQEQQELRHEKERRQVQRQRVHDQEEDKNHNRKDDDDDKKKEKKKRQDEEVRDDSDRKRNNKNTTMKRQDEDDDKEEDTEQKEVDRHKNKKRTRRGGSVETENIFSDETTDAAPSPSSLSSAPTPTPTETICKSIIAIGSTRLHPDDPDLLTLSPEEVRKLKTDDTLEGDEDFVCELYSGDFVPLHSTSKQLHAMRMALQQGVIVSSVSTIEYVVPETVEIHETGNESSVVEEEEEEEGGEDDDDDEGKGGKKITDIPSSAPTTTATTTVIESVVLPPGNILIHTDPVVLNEHMGRRHLRYSGTKPLLVVRVIDSTGATPPGGDAAYVSNKFFGTYGDTETIVSQFASCSYNKFNIVYDTSYGPYEAHIKNQLSAPGVLEVQLPISMYNSKNDIRRETQLAVESKLGIKLPGPFSHVLFVLPQCVVDCGFAAYAYVGSYLSVYQGVYYQYPAVAMHEIGHNLNFGHSGGKTSSGEECAYCDHTDLMGNPLYKDDVADMCFNPAKTFQITVNGGDWYDPTRIETFDPFNGAWSGTLVGIAEYGNMIGNTDHMHSRIVLKIETGTKLDLYLGFNRATGMNEDVKQGLNMVTIVEANGDGLSYSTSVLLATLTQGQTYSVSNWRGTGVTLTVFVDLIRYMDVVPGYASVRVMFDGQRAGGVTTSPPTSRPTRQPITPRPKPGDPTPPPTPLPTPLPTPSPTPEPTLPPTESPVTESPTSLSPTDSMVRPEYSKLFSHSWCCVYFLSL